LIDLTPKANAPILVNFAANWRDKRRFAPRLLQVRAFAKNLLNEVSRCLQSVLH
jgi:hypothetical protein